MTVRTLSYARMAQPFVHAPLFRSFAKGEQARYKLDVTYQYSMRNGSSSTYRFWGPEPLGATDLLVLQGLVAVATGRLSMPGGVKQMLRDGRSQRAQLVLTEDAYTERTVAARFVLYGFAIALGYSSPSGSTLERLRRSIERMSAVTVLAASPKFRGSFHLLSGYVEDSATGEVVVGLNPHLTGSVLARTGYLRVSFDEVRKLKTDAARLIHSRLHWINQGDSRVVGVPTLSEYVYCGARASGSALSNRKATIHRAMRELDELGWGIDRLDAMQYRIARPARKSTAQRSRATAATGRTVNWVLAER